MLSERHEAIAKTIVNSAYQVHRKLGPGLLEKIYEVCLAHEIKKTGFEVERQISIPIVYDGIKFEEGLRIDLLVDRLVVVEIKAIDLTNPVWDAQVLSQLKLSRLNLGFLINFNVPLIKNGIKRFIT